MPSKILLYGATGYTGQLIAEAAIAAGLSPILGGRSPSKLAPVATALGLESRAAALTNPQALTAALDDVAVILNVAGPFGETAPPLVAAATAQGVHYLDLAGEVPEFERLLRHDAAARVAGSMIMPGVGFGVVPTDCLARHLHANLPDATHLTLAYETVGGVSQGTAQTVFGELLNPGVVRTGGRLVAAMPASQSKAIDFGQGLKKAVLNPWRGDLSTAFRTTGIPNMEVYTAFPAPVPQLMAASRWLGTVWRSATIQGWLARLIKRLPVGPDAAARQAGRTHLWGEVRNVAGQRYRARLHGPEAYQFTAQSAVAIVQRVLAGEFQPGVQTPASVYGADFVLGLDGVRREVLAA